MNKIPYRHIAGTVVLCLVFVVMISKFIQFKSERGTSDCQSHLRIISGATMMYRADHNDKFPLAAVNENITGSTPAQPMPAYGWADALYPYIEGGMERFHCPRGSATSYEPKEKDYTDYWFNINMSALRQSVLAKPAQTFTFGEGNDGDDHSNARYSKGRLAPDWLNRRNSPSSRHENGANYAFADGHVKWLKPNQVGSSSTYKFTAK